jgi:DNA-binding transcriptional LysR family regulator
LRNILGDPLLVRTGQKLEITPYARYLIGPVEAACEALEAVLQAPGFEPAQAQRFLRLRRPTISRLWWRRVFKEIISNDLPGRP